MNEELRTLDEDLHKADSGQRVGQIPRRDRAMTGEQRKRDSFRIQVETFGLLEEICDFVISRTPAERLLKA